MVEEECNNRLKISGITDESAIKAEKKKRWVTKGREEEKHAINPYPGMSFILSY